MDYHINAIYKEGNDIVLRLVPTHLSIGIENKNSDVKLSDQILKSIFNGVMPMAENDHETIISIPEIEWNHLEIKYSIGDVFRVEFKDNGIILDKITD